MRRPLRSIAVLAALGLAVVGCSSEGSDGGRATTDPAPTTSVAASPSDGEATTTEPASTTSEAATSTTGGSSTAPSDDADGGLCAVVDEAVVAFSPDDASLAAFEAIRNAWADLAGVLPAPHDATAQAVVDVYDGALPSFGGDPADPSSAFVQSYTSGLTPLVARSFALARHVEDECEVTLPGF